MADQTVVLHGYRDYLRACDRAGKESKTYARTAYREVGNIVRDDWRQRVQSDGSAADSKTAAGLRTYVRQRGINVEQSLRRTTGHHPDWGAWQMRRGVDALGDNEQVVMGATDDAIDRIADHFYGRAF